MREFSTLHPFVILLYFISVIFFTMFQTHPIFLISSLVISIIFAIKTLGVAELKKKLLFFSIFFIIIALSNPLFVHKGVTPLFYMDGNAVTLEATIYGVVFASMLVSVIIWFASFNKIMTSDKIIYIFSSIIPTIGLIISMILRFVPRFQLQLNKIIDINKVAGDPFKSKGIKHRLMTIFNMFSILLTWAFENSIDTANSMKARGYGLKGRTTFHLYKFETRDLIFMLLIVGLVSLNIFNYYNLDLRFYYYPEIASIRMSIFDILAYLSNIIFLILPLILEIKEELKWKSLISKI